MSSGCTKRCSMSYYSMSWAHHARLEATSLAASATVHWIQAGSFGVQSAEWPVSTIFGGWLPAYRTTGRRRLQLSNIATCEVLRTCTSLGDRSLTVVGPHLRNNLPLHLHNSELTHLEFCRLLNMHLFCWGQRRLVIICFLSAP